MSFTTLVFAIFLIIVFAVYWLILGKRYKWQNLWLLAAGYVFYGWWDWRFLFLIFATTLVSWGCAMARKRRKTFATLSIVFNLFVLCLFKYFNFFGDGLRLLLETFGVAVDWFTIDVLLPIGISFYSFQAISYNVDVYKKKIEPCGNLLTYSLYIAFFPQLVAGPIEKARDLLLQFERPRRWDYGKAVLGMRQILWGLFKKCVVADGLAFWVSNGFETHINDGTVYGNFQCFLATIGFALQIYGDFSGYSDIARGSARLFGINLMNNFLYPYFSRNGIEVWRRWHRSLMEWFAEYVYRPLGGSRSRRRFLNVIIVFLLSGLWHGAKETFIIWGALCGLWYILATLCGARSYKPDAVPDPTRSDMPKIAFTFVLFAMCFVSFRSNGVSDIVLMWRNLIFPGLPLFVAIIGCAWIVKICRIGLKAILIALAFVAAGAIIVSPADVIRYGLGLSGFVGAFVMLVAEWMSRRNSFALEKMPSKRWVRIAIYSILYILVFSNAVDTGNNDFIYFQF